MLLVAVEPGGPTAAAGLRGGDHAVPLPGRVIYEGGDIITHLDGQAITGMSDVVNQVQAKEPGDCLSVTYLRDGRTAHAEVTLGVRPDDL